MYEGTPTVCLVKDTGVFKRPNTFSYISRFRRFNAPLPCVYIYKRCFFKNTLHQWFLTFFQPLVLRNPLLNSNTYIYAVFKFRFSVTLYIQFLVHQQLLSGL